MESTPRHRTMFKLWRWSSQWMKLVKKTIAWPWINSPRKLPNGTRPPKDTEMGEAGRFPHSMVAGEVVEVEAVEVEAAAEVEEEEVEEVAAE
eukprot:scaffold7536_cov83-Cylindrotheca_fusiformis.AAC.1